MAIFIHNSLILWVMVSSIHTMVDVKRGDCLLVLLDFDLKALHRVRNLSDKIKDTFISVWW